MPSTHARRESPSTSTRGTTTHVCTHGPLLGPKSKLQREKETSEPCFKGVFTHTSHTDTHKPSHTHLHRSTYLAHISYVHIHNHTHAQVHTLTPYLPPLTNTSIIYTQNFTPSLTHTLHSSAHNHNHLHIDAHLTTHRYSYTQAQSHPLTHVHVTTPIYTHWHPVLQGSKPSTLCVVVNGVQGLVNFQSHQWCSLLPSGALGLGRCQHRLPVPLTRLTKSSLFFTRCLGSYFMYSLLE